MRARMRLLSPLALALALLASRAGAWMMMVGRGGRGASTSLARAGARGLRMQVAPSTAAATSRAWDGEGVGFLDPREVKRPSLQAAEARFLDHLQACPFIAVLRGVQSSADVGPTLQALAAEGWTLASVPAEAPAGLGSLASIVNGGGVDSMMLGAATVVSVEQVERAADSGAAFISCPHVDGEIIERAIARGLVVLPGVLTPTEAFQAVKHGARILKLFPSQAIPPGMVKSLRAVLPPHVHLLVSGGVQPEDLQAYLRAGAIGFALGSTLYQAGLEPEELARRARLFRDSVARGRETDAWAAATLGL